MNSLPQEHKHLYCLHWNLSDFSNCSNTVISPNIAPGSIGLPSERKWPQLRVWPSHTLVALIVISFPQEHLQVKYVCPLIISCLQIVSSPKICPVRSSIRVPPQF